MPVPQLFEGESRLELGAPVGVRTAELLSTVPMHVYQIGQVRHGPHTQGFTTRFPTLDCTTSQYLAANTATRPSWTPRRRLLREPACCMPHDRCCVTGRAAVFTSVC